MTHRRDRGTEWLLGLKDCKHKNLNLQHTNTVWKRNVPCEHTGSNYSKCSLWSTENALTASPRLFILSLKDLSPGDVKKLTSSSVSASEFTEALKALTFSCHEKFRAEIFAENCAHGFLWNCTFTNSRQIAVAANLMWTVNILIFIKNGKILGRW